MLCLNCLYSVNVIDIGEYNYNDIGMEIIKEVMEKVTNKSYNDLLKEYIIEKLSLKDTFLVVPNSDLGRVTATPNADEYIRKSFGGGWCYADERYTGVINPKTYVYDVNSLYPAMMYYNVFPIGMPTFTKNIKDLRFGDKFFFIRFKCNFELKTNHLPFVQLKHDWNFRSNENLKSTRYDRWGNLLRGYKVEITMSCVMFKLFIQC